MANLIFVDVESDGPAPGLYSMVCFGAVKFKTMETFYGKTAPITQNFIHDALAVSGITRAEHEEFPSPLTTMSNFDAWLKVGDRPIFVSDNPAFDYQFINYYFHKFIGRNPFGYSARRIGDFYAGLVKDYNQQNKWKRLRQTLHDHNPVNDALGNVEAFRAMCQQHSIILS